MTEPHTGPHLEPDDLLGLALAELDASDQDRLIGHLAGCPGCRDDYAELSDGVQQALAATPAIAPPAGFSGRVLAAMGTGGPTRPAVRRRWPAIAAAALAGLVLGVGGTLAATTLLEPPATSAPDSVATDLLTATGEPVGSAGLTTHAGRPYLLLTVTAGEPGASYDCILVAADGARSNGGSWQLGGDYGAGSGAWLVPVSGDPPAAVELARPSGQVWATATF